MRPDCELAIFRSVITAIECGRDPLEHIALNAPLVDNAQNPPELAKCSRDTRAAAVMARIYTSKGFSREVEKRSANAGLIVDKALRGLDMLVEKYVEHAAEPSRDIHSAEMAVMNDTFLRAAQMVMSFYRETQRQTTKHSANASGAAMRATATAALIPGAGDEVLVDALRDADDAELAALAGDGSPESGEVMEAALA